ncbi:MAG: metallophosphoesterase [Prevotellaceae bacterium]|jgi:predicted MPP superfamily phosphohydrolase|nr:metallophosphoesterase [Prevotellaceae bacterium]
MEEILIVPDIHGRNFWKPALDYKGMVIFLGDYTDPYPQEGFTQDNAYQNLLKIVDFKKQNPDRVILLVGNHEMHYYNKNYACGRFDYHYFQSYNAILTGKETAGLFQMCKQIDNYLFIHAGITKGWYDAHRDELSKLGNTLEEQMNNLFVTNINAFYEASMYRGGYHEAGSPLWADATEHFDEKEHFSDTIIQIIGHTQLTIDEPLVEGNVRLVDNRQLYLLKNDKIVKYVAQ